MSLEEDPQEYLQGYIRELKNMVTAAETELQRVTSLYEKVCADYYTKYVGNW